MSETLIEKYPFFFKVSCSCCNHPKYSNILTKTGCLFLIPAFLFFYNPSNTLTIINGSLTLMLCMTSITYHLIHEPVYRCMDIITVYLTSTMSIITIISWWNELYNFFILLSILFFTIVFIINFNKNLITIKNYISLEHHILIHLCTNLGFTMFAIHNLCYNR